MAGGQAARAQTGGESTDFQAIYGAYYLGLKLMETRVEASFDGDSYETTSLYRTGGLVAWARKDEIVSTARGGTDGETLVPEYFQHRDILEHGRTVTMDFEPEDIEVIAEPPYLDFGDPPATRAQRAGAFDIASGMIQASMNIGDDAEWPCGRDIPIFDGKQRYDLRLAHAGTVQAETGAYTGPAIACHVYYIPVAGFDADDYPEDKYLNTPLTVLFMDSPESDIHIPVRFSYPVGLGTLVIEAKSLAVQSAAVRDHAAR